MMRNTRPLLVHRMDGVQRILLALAGSALLAAAVAALFVSENELGTVAIAVIGAVLLALGIAGLVPTRVSWKDLDVVLAEIADAAIAVAGPSGAEAILAEARDVLPGAAVDEAMRRVSIAFQFEQAVVQALHRVSQEGAEVIQEQGAGPDRGVDAVVRVGNQQLFVQIKTLNPSGSLMSIRDLSARASLVGGHWLVVTNRQLPSAAREQLERTNVSLVAWSGVDDDSALARAVQDALSTQTR